MTYQLSPAQTALYADAAAGIPKHAFYGLRRIHNAIPGVPHMAEGAGVIVDFTPGDATLYRIVIMRLTASDASVSVVNMGHSFHVPFRSGAYVDPSYLDGQTHGAINPCTIEAVAAVINHAIDSCYEDG